MPYPDEKVLPGICVLYYSVRCAVEVYSSCEVRDLAVLDSGGVLCGINAVGAACVAPCYACPFAVHQQVAALSS